MMEFSTTVETEQLKIDEDLFEFIIDMPFSKLRESQDLADALQKDDIADDKAERTINNLMTVVTNVPMKTVKKLPVPPKLQIIRRWSELIQGTLSPLPETSGSELQERSDSTEEDLNPGSLVAPESSQP